MNHNTGWNSPHCILDINTCSQEKNSSHPPQKYGDKEQEGGESDHHVLCLLQALGLTQEPAPINTFSSIIEVDISEVDKHDITWLKHHGVHYVFPTRATCWLRYLPVHSVHCQFKL